MQLSRLMFHVGHILGSKGFKVESFESTDASPVVVRVMKAESGNRILEIRFEKSCAVMVHDSSQTNKVQADFVISILEEYFNSVNIRYGMSSVEGFAPGPKKGKPCRDSKA